MMAIRILLFLIGGWSSPSWSSTCSYQTWTWHTIQKKTVDHRTVKKSRLDLTADERGEVSGCSVCEEDQIEIKVQGLPPFKICKVFGERITGAIEAAKLAGFQFKSIIGYRVGKSRGPIDPAGLRTQFSNHSYGAAIDFNAELNGLYDNCINFTETCRLIRGGIYRAGEIGTITKQSAIYEHMLKVGFKWGGEIQGRQKDFMHFSISGY